MAPHLTVYFDVVSPFGYLAHYVLRHDPVFAAVKIRYVPILLGGVMAACGNTAPLYIKNKDKWINQDRKRWASAFKIPIHNEMPDGFPVKTIPIMRALCVLDALHSSPAPHPSSKASKAEGEGKGGQEKLLKVLDILLDRFWVHHDKVYESDVFTKVFEDVLGKEDAEKILSQVPTKGKEILRQNTDQVFADGAFGLPWFVASPDEGKEEESFWGFDHLGQVCDFLEIERPYGKGAAAAAGEGSDGSEGNTGWKSML